MFILACASLAAQVAGLVMFAIFMRRPCEVKVTVAAPVAPLSIAPTQPALAPQFDDVPDAVLRIASRQAVQEQLAFEAEHKHAQAERMSNAIEPHDGREHGHYDTDQRERSVAIRAGVLLGKKLDPQRARDFAREALQ